MMSRTEQALLLGLAWLPVPQRVLASCCSRGVRARFVLAPNGVLDLAEAGDSITDAVLKLMLGELRGPLKRLRISSREVSFALLERVVEEHGEQLEAIELAGCDGAAGMQLMDALSQHCVKGTLRCIELSVANPGQVSLISSAAPAPPLKLSLNSRLDLVVPVPSAPNFPVTCESLSVLVRKLGSALRVLRLMGSLDVASHHGVSLITENCPELEELSLGAFQVSLSPRMGQWRCRGDGIGEAHFTELAWPQSITSLSLRGCAELSSSAAGLIPSALPGLTSLDLSGIVLVDDAAVGLLAAGLPCLHHLDLSCCLRVTHRGLRSLAMGAPQLKSLDLHYCPISDQSVQCLLEHCRNLERINLSLTPIRDRAVQALEANTSLRLINLRCCKFLLASPLKPIPRLRRAKQKKACTVLGDEQVSSCPQSCEKVPRQLSLKNLSTWKGFNGVPGDAVRQVILKLKPLAHHIEFGPRGSHKYPRIIMRHQALMGLSKEEDDTSSSLIEVDTEGCAIASGARRREVARPTFRF
jgi:hypothetical protein